MRRLLLAAVVLTATLGAAAGSANVSSGPILAYSVLYPADAKADEWTDGGVCATDPKGHSFRVTDPYLDRYPAWSPDGKHIAFTRGLERVPGSVGDVSDVYIADATGGHLRNLTARIAGQWNGQSSWSPDGRRLAFVSGWYGDGLFVVNADGTGSTEIASVPHNWDLGFPSWSPDGQRILFTEYLGGPVGVFVIDADGSNETKVVGSASEAVWSPDGKRIAYLAWHGSRTALAVMDADSTSPPHVLTGDGLNSGPAWSPDGGWIAFEEGGRLMVIRPDGIGEHAADTDGRPTADPAWRPAAALPANRRPCVISGTSRADVIRGTNRGDLINGKGSNDTIYGRGGDDVLIGGSGHDHLYGGGGRDLFGASDGHRDVLLGGPGFDSAYFDNRDRLRSVELNALTGTKP
jgi:TolB protein